MAKMRALQKCGVTLVVLFDAAHEPVVRAIQEHRRKPVVKYEIGSHALDAIACTYFHDVFGLRRADLGKDAVQDAVFAVLRKDLGPVIPQTVALRWG